MAEKHKIDFCNFTKALKSGNDSLFNAPTIIVKRADGTILTADRINTTADALIVNL